MSRRLLIAALLVLVLLAGCSALSGSGASPTETLTPPPVPTDRPTAAPGVPATNGTASLDTGQLLAADERERNSTSYTLIRTVEIRGPNWTTTIRRDRRVRADGTLYENVETNGSAALRPAIARTELWKDDSAVFVRTYDHEGTRIEQGPFPSVPGHFRRWTLLREGLLTTGKHRIRQTAGGAVIRTVNAPVDEAVIPISLGEPRNASARVVVAESGLIRSLRLEYDTTYRGDRVRVEIHHRTENVGNTTVSRPDWTE